MLVISVKKLCSSFRGICFLLVDKWSRVVECRYAIVYILNHLNLFVIKGYKVSLVGEMGELGSGVVKEVVGSISILSKIITILTILISNIGKLQKKKFELACGNERDIY